MGIEKNIKVVIVEDEPLIAEDLRFLLNSINYTVIGVAQSSLKAMDIIRTRKPDIVLLDISIKGDKDGVDIAHMLNEQYKIPFIYLTSYADQETIDRAKLTMPYGYIIKPFDERDLLSSIEMALYRHEKQHSNELPKLEDINQSLATEITEREYELLCGLASGLTNQQMAEHFYISLNTVKFHLKNLFAKMDVVSRSAAVAKFYELK